MVKSNNEIGKVNDKKDLTMKQKNSEIGKKVLTDGLDLSYVFLQKQYQYKQGWQNDISVLL